MTADVFQSQRPHLLALAYQMLGELAAAEDIVQDAWMRWDAAVQSEIRSPEAWLHSVVTRLAIDQLRSARHRRESYTGTWLPEPILESDSGSAPEHLVEVAQDCELALLWVLERLSAEERAAFLLRQVFDTSYGDIAVALNRSESSCRQLVSRASRKVQEESPRYSRSEQQLEEVMYNFAAAAAAGDKQAVIDMLAPDVVSVSDGGGVVRAVLIPLEGPERVAQVLTHIVSKAAAKHGVQWAPKLARVNGRPAFVTLDDTDEDMIFTLRTNEAGQISWIYMLRNPLKLAAARGGNG